MLHAHIEANHGDKLKSSVKQAAYLTAFWVASQGKLVARLSGMRLARDENPKRLKFSTKRKPSASSAEDPADAAHQGAAGREAAWKLVNAPGNQEEVKPGADAVDAAQEGADRTIGPADWSPSRVTRKAAHGTTDQGQKIPLTNGHKKDREVRPKGYYTEDASATTGTISAPERPRAP